uniref:Uncharacterized protein n=1 Tax=Rhizophora mucronata TaxID=61149 RepID=A0A2P2QPQ0_RHIMU
MRFPLASFTCRIVKSTRLFTLYFLLLLLLVHELPLLKINSPRFTEGSCVETDVVKVVICEFHACFLTLLTSVSLLTICFSLSQEVSSSCL